MFQYKQKRNFLQGNFQTWQSLKKLATIPFLKMKFEELVTHDFFGPYLNVKDVISLSLVSKKLATDLLTNQIVDRTIWKSLCKTTFDYCSNEDLVYRKTYAGFHKWKTSPFYIHESFVKESTTTDHPISAVNEFGVGVMLGDFPLYVYPVYWDGSLIRCFTAGKESLTY